MEFDEVIRLKTLHLKSIQQEPVPPYALAPGEQPRQLCAMVSPSLFREVESLCTLLSLSKREFIELALIEAISRAQIIAADVNPFSVEPGSPPFPFTLEFDLDDVHQEEPTSSKPTNKEAK
jgi:hypothetical protein